MATMKHKHGTVLQTGVSDSGISGAHSQTSGRNAAGDLKIYHDKDGNDLSVYVSDPHVEMTFEAVLEASVVDKEIGDPITINNKNYVVTQWNVSESNDDVKKVSIGVRSTDITVTSPAPAGQGS